ncbi:hypothetical protein BP5796_07104 [Coleophoma crateriformis]|uniref:Uncharacterized protein n=1 Tax=Coleophoma crateriformis TaxID=565419 RepID=A0A3D8RHY9_9HELO|nr:hypothetical protein BP5796_07104 [Coleophoma crateriformis]
MAHQTHALPWNTLASYFKYQKDYESPQPQTWDVYSHGDAEKRSKALGHFSRVFCKQIQEFAATERAKYEPKEHYRKQASTWKKSVAPEPRTEEQEAPPKKKNQSAKETRMIMSDELLRRSNDSGLDFQGETQNVENWLLSAGRSYSAWVDGGDMLKVLMMEAAAAKPAMSTEPEHEEMKRESMETLLLMANHPDMDILSLRNMHHGHHYGVSRVAEEATKAYLWLNLMTAMREAGSPICDPSTDPEAELPKNYLNCDTYQRMLRSVAGNYDGDAQCLVHRDFFCTKEGQHYTSPNVPYKDVLAEENMGAVREYLKGVWRVMVIYDIVIREAGGDPDWDHEFNSVFRYKPYDS